MASTAGAVRIEADPQHDGVALLTIDRPPVNALGAAGYHDLADALEAVAADPGVRAVVLTGAGERAFCAGTDMRDFESGDGASAATAAGWRMFTTLGAMPKPVVGALNGPAVGGGCAITTECDVLVAVPTMHFSIPEVALGFTGGGSHIKRLAPWFKAQRMLLLGERLEAGEAHAAGTVAALADDRDALLALALDVAGRLAALDPDAVREARRIFRGPEGAAALTGYREELDLLERLLRGRRAAG
ncbi:enoyl-CoA hydratase/isomerase family protein [Baekduia soli]|uniref:Enoyl-CoA hydratase/isomerase family protein n=1 Tax=Baekduia soli TaxID=496014 RepID=A0A5B8U2P7_9ACTN|nr:enoyl-CoA hydratase/isomerase family protein [Baekduia soli]QEC47238.1 enoyl-CoA hydratase/isomerase family protein [Baekduia soli]